MAACAGTSAHPRCVPGLLQTERRTRALYEMRTPLLNEDIIEQRVASRMDRQEILTYWPPPMVTAVIEETVLQRPLGGPEVHREQLEQLLKLGRLRNVELQVMPTDRSEHAGMGGPFVLLTPKGKPQVGYIEAQSSSRLITDSEDVRILAARYGSIRAQALTMRYAPSYLPACTAHRGRLRRRRGADRGGFVPGVDVLCGRRHLVVGRDRAHRDGHRDRCGTVGEWQRRREEPPCQGRGQECGRGFR